MATNLYVGNLPFSTTSGELESLFASYGEVVDARIITDRELGRSRGFGFVEMASDEEAQKAIAELNDSEIEGRRITVNVARERRPDR
ncbi:MAG: RNA recognition motif domain-containing protein [Acidimicrobiia bacterium]